MTNDERAQRLEALFVRTRAGIKPGLELSRELLAQLDNPQDKFLVVHVAGTNGKGSVCALTEALLRAMGLRTGLFTSPHLVRVNERIRIAGEEIEDCELDSCLDRIAEAETSCSRPATFFETLSAAAFLAFARAGVQVAVVETGLGGRWDSTNVVNPLVSVLTPVAIDHAEILGDTLEAIAGEKAGIIKPGRPVVCGPQAECVEAVLRETAARQDAPFVLASERVGITAHSSSLDGQKISIETHEQNFGRFLFPLSGAFQLDALTLALSTIQQVEQVLPLELEPGQMKAAFETLEWKARCQVLKQDPPVILDVAHNPAAASALVETLRGLFGRKQKGILVFGAMADKDAGAVLRILRTVTGQVLTVSINSPRAESATELAAMLPGAQPRELTAALREAEQLARDGNSFVLIAGSVYLAGEILGGVTDAGENPALTESVPPGETDRAPEA